jgi:hypothetical protein
MKISELIETLTDMKTTHGDVECVIEVGYNVYDETEYDMEPVEYTKFGDHEGFKGSIQLS